MTPRQNFKTSIIWKVTLEAYERYYNKSISHIAVYDKPNVCMKMSGQWKTVNFTNKGMEVK